MKVRVKKTSDQAVMPGYSRSGDGALDLVAASVEFKDKFIEYDTHIVFEIPEGYVGLLFPRSSVTNTDLILGNCVGLIDPNYRGTIRFRYKKLFHTGTDEEREEDCDACGGDGFMPDKEVEKLQKAGTEVINFDCPICDGSGHFVVYDMYGQGDKVGQILIIERPYIEIVGVKELTETNRGEEGFGSSDSLQTTT